MPGRHVSLSSGALSQPGQIAGIAPELRLIETDQVDPAGQYRLGVTADSFLIARSQAVSYGNALGSSSDTNFLLYDRVNTIYSHDAQESSAWYIRLLAGATVQTESRVTVGASTAALTGVRVNTGDGAASLVERIAVLMGAASVDIDISAARLDLNGNVVAGLVTLRGEGTADVAIRPNKAVTDVTARNVQFLLLDPATDAETLLAQMTANGLTPSLDLQDDLLLRIGTTGDTGIANRSTALAANTALTGILEGVPVTPVAIAANSLLVGNITDDGDIVLAVSKAGTSHMAFMADASTGDTLLGASTGQSVDLYVAGAKEYDFSASAADFAGNNITTLGTLNTHTIPGGTDTFALLAAAQTFATGVKTFNSSILAIHNPAGTFSYTVVASAIAAARNLTIPLLTADDTLAVLGLAQNFTQAITFSLAGSAVSITGATGNTLAVDTNVLVVDATENRVGVNVTTPLYPLDVYRASDGAVLAINRTGVAGWQFYVGNVSLFTGVTAGGSLEIRSDTGALEIAIGQAGATVPNFRIKTGSIANVLVIDASAGTGNIILGGSAHGTGSTFNLVLSGGTATPVIGAATADLVHLAGVDIAALDRRLAIQSEAGSVIYLGNDILRFAAATGIIGIGATSVISSTATLLTVPIDILVSLGIRIGADSGNNEIDDATQGAASTTLYIGNASINVTSDMRVKGNFTDYTHGLDLIRRLHVQEFDQKDLKPFGGYDGRYVGFTAQHLYQVAPWTVNTQGGAECWECRTGLPCDDHLPWQARQEFLMGPIVQAVQEIDRRLETVEMANRILRKQLIAAGIMPEE